MPSARPHELAVVDLVAVLLDQHAEQAVAGLFALLAHDLQQVPQRLRDRPQRRARTAEQVEPRGAQPLEVRPVLVGHAEQFADRERRDRQRELLPQVHRTVRGGHRVQLVRDDLVDPRRQPGKPAHRELGRQQLPQARVDRRVGESEAARVLVLGDARVADEVREVVAELRALPEDGLGLLVAGHEPGVHPERQVQLADRRLAAQPAEVRNRVETLAAQRLQRRIRQQRHLLEIETALLLAGDVPAARPGEDARTKTPHGGDSTATTPSAGPGRRRPSPCDQRRSTVDSRHPAR